MDTDHFDLYSKLNHGLFMNGWERSHVTRGNRSAIECQESFQKYASFEEELLLCLGLLGPYKICMAWFGEK